MEHLRVAGAAVLLEDQNHLDHAALPGEGPHGREIRGPSGLDDRGVRRQRHGAAGDLDLVALDHDLGVEHAELGALELVVGPARHAGHPVLALLDEDRLARTRELNRLEAVVVIHPEQALHSLEVHVGASRRGAGLTEVASGQVVRTLLGVNENLLHRDLLGTKRGRRSHNRITRNGAVVSL